jgi:hypothetical protein
MISGFLLDNFMICDKLLFEKKKKKKRFNNNFEFNS